MSGGKRTQRFVERIRRMTFCLQNAPMCTQRQPLRVTSTHADGSRRQPNGGKVGKGGDRRPDHQAATNSCT
ncbi:hypothetical protein DB771_04845 [Burkholderia sp. AU29985]|nr:hypothetical protein EGY28_06790 [Burkholderia dolosa]PRE44250.1 hypothetical protein C6P87_23490 [Burkholderia sp. AU12872]PUA77973.1 hypothetical protein DB771_04845 [Burkholderia sp. AU29985]